jgi:hypothetical protein
MTKTPAFVLALLLVGCGGSKGSGKSASTGDEVVETKVSLDLPDPPAFEEPAVNADGTHSVIEMRRRGGKYAEQVVKIKGYVVFKYNPFAGDCAAVLGEKVAKDNPERCERPHFYLGDQPNTSQDRAVWVVEVPRAPREDEKKVLPKEELNDPTLWPPEPVYMQGDLVEVEGTWATKSPSGFVNSDGLMVFKGMTVITPINPEPEPKKKGR